MTSVTKLTAIYPGTFDPMTLGHEDLMRRASRLFERLVVAVAAGHHKRTMFTIDERLEIAQELALNPSTVSNHLAHVREKLGATSNADVLRYAHRVGLLD
jgi:cytidyltransferase-like protein